ncbi:MAG: hypothetical protein WCP85_12520 [Mariniphaga sp.]
MKKIVRFILFAIAVFTCTNSGYSQTIYQFPENGTPFFKVTIPYNWDVKYLNDPGRPANDHGEIAFLPKDLNAATGPFVAITRAAMNPDSPNATAEIINGSKEFVSGILTEVKWKGTPQAITSTKGLTFITDTGSGIFINDNGSREARVCALYYFSPDDRQKLGMVTIATQAAMDKYGTTLTQIINSIGPGK